MKIKEQNSTQAGAVLLVSAIIVKLIGAVFKIPLSADYVLGDLGFGYFSAVYDLYIPIYTLSLSGFPVAIAKLISDFNAQKREEEAQKTFLLSYKFLLLLGVIGSFVFLSLAPISLMRNSSSSFYSHLVSAPSVLFCCVASVYRGYFEGLKNMVPTAVSNIIEALCKLFLGLSGAFITMRLTNDPALSSAMALVGITLGTVLSCLYLRVKFKKNNIFKNAKLRQRVYDRVLFKNFYSIVIPVAIASLAVGITAFIDSITLIPQLNSLIKICNDESVLLKGTLYKDVVASKIPTLLYGIKGKAHTLFNLVPTLTTAFGVGTVPLIAQYFVLENSRELKKNVDLCLKFSALFSMPIAFGFIFIGGGITELLYGVKSAVLGGRMLSVYGVAALFGGISVSTSLILQAIGRQRKALVNIIVGLSLKLFCNLCLTPVENINIYSACIGTAACFTVIFVLNMWVLIESLGFLPDLKNSLLKPLISALLCGFTAFIISNIFVDLKVGTIISIGIAGVVYLIVLALLKTIKKEEVIELVKNK